MEGSSLMSFRPKRRKSLVVLYGRMGRPMTCFRPGGGDELAGHQGAEDATGVDAADLGDLGEQ